MKRNPLVTAMIVVLAALVGLVALTAPDQKTVKSERLGFHVLESSYLYFRNLREVYYIKTQDERSGYDLFSLDTGVWPGFTIVHNWRNDQAYILLQDSTETFDQPTVLTLVSGDREENFQLSEINMESQQQIAVAVFEFIQNTDSKFSLKLGNETFIVWNEPDDRKRIEQVLADYFKLVGAL